MMIWSYGVEAASWSLFSWDFEKAMLSDSKELQVSNFLFKRENYLKVGSYIHSELTWEH